MNITPNTQTILQTLGISELNEMQQQAYHNILTTEKDIVILSPTGSGKTLAYLLPLVEKIDKESDKVQMIVVVPSRELALQSSEVLQKMACGVRCCACYGGRTAMEEHKTLKKIAPHVVFATPGRLNDHLLKENILPDNVSLLVIDEFDKCLAMGFHEEMIKAINALPNVQRKVLLSATEAEEIPRFVQLNRTTKLSFLAQDENISSRIALFTVNSDEKDKLKTLSKLLHSLNNESSIVFLNYRESVERVNNFLKEESFYTSSYHGGSEQKEREAALYKFANGSANILVSTDLASRGLDIPDLNNVINYHLPETEDNYIHRVGRTARWEKEGKTFFILAPEETLPTYVLTEATDYLLPETPSKIAPPKMVTLYIGKGKKDKISKMDVVGFLCKKGNLDKNEIGRIDVKDRYTYVAIARNKLKQVLRLTNGEKIKNVKTVIEEIK